MSVEGGPVELPAWTIPNGYQDTWKIRWSLTTACGLWSPHLDTDTWLWEDGELICSREIQHGRNQLTHQRSSYRSTKPGARVVETEDPKEAGIGPSQGTIPGHVSLGWIQQWGWGRVLEADLSHRWLEENKGDPLSGNPTHPRLHIQQGEPSKNCEVWQVQGTMWDNSCGMPADYAVERNVSVISLKATRVGARSSRTQDKEEGEPVK